MQSTRNRRVRPASARTSADFIEPAAPELLRRNAGQIRLDVEDRRPVQHVHPGDEQLRPVPSQERHDGEPDRVRAARNTELSALDVPFMRAIETGDEAKRQVIAAAKQRLRDLPLTIDVTRAETLDELKALWPEDLPRQ